MNDRKLINPGKWYAEYDENGNCTSTVYCDSFRKLIGFESEDDYTNTQDSWNGSIYSEDEDRVQAYFAECLKKHPEGMDFDIEYRMLTSQGYRWFHDFGNITRRPDGSVIRLDGVVFDIQFAVDMEDIRKNQIARMAGGVSSYILNPNTGKFHTLSQNDYLARKYPDDEDFATSMSRYIDSDVYPSDKDMVREAISQDALVKNLEKQDEYTVRFRDISSGKPLWYEMRAVRLSENEILYGFVSKDMAIIDEMIFNRLKNDFFGLFYVNLDTGDFQTVIKSPWYDFGEVGEFASFSERFGKFAAAFSGETGEFFTKLSNIEFLRHKFSEEDMAVYNYKSVFVRQMSWVSVEGHVLKRNADGSPQLIILGFSYMDEDASEKEEARLKLKESMEVVGGLADKYSALYHVNLDTGEYVPYHLSSQNADIQPYFKQCPRFVDLARLYALSGMVHPDDRDALLAFCPSEEAAREALREKSRKSMFFRRKYGDEYLWNEIEIIKCEAADEEPHSAIVGFIDKDDEIKRGMAADESNKLIENLTSKYSVVYVVDMADDSVEVRKMDPRMRESRMNFTSFTQVRDFTVAEVFHPRCGERMRREMEFGTIRQKLAAKPSYKVEYCALRYNVTFWGEMIITALGGDKIAVGMIGRDLELLKRNLEEKRYSEYLALFIVDLDTEMIRPAKVTPLFGTVGINKAAPYREAMLTFASIYEGETRDFFTEVSDVDFLRSEFTTDDKRTYSFKATRIDGNKWIDVISYVLERHDDGTPAMITFGFSLVDTLATARKELQSRLKEDMQMIGGLANEYKTLYYLNLSDGTFKLYSADGKKQPETKRLSAGDGDPFALLRRFGGSDTVHPDDRALFADVTADLLRERLAHSKRSSIRFRRRVGDEYQWCEMEAIKYEDIDEPANAIAVGFANRDAEIRAEQVLNSCFSILGKEIPPQESIDELLAITGEFYGSERSYIFEFSKNGEVLDNTYEWCKEGIEAMLSQLQGIPAAEVDGWLAEFRRHGAFFMDTLDKDGAYDSEEGRALLEMQGIDSLIAAPIVKGDEIVGFIGVDNPTKAKKNVAVLRNIAAVVYSEILQREENDEEHVTLEKLADTFMSVYYVDLSRDYMHNWKIDKEYSDAYRNVSSYSGDMGGYVRENIAERDRERCMVMTSPEYIVNQLRTGDRFSVGMTDIMLGYERSVVFDFVKVSDDGRQFVMCCRDVSENLAKEKEQQRLLAEARDAADAANKSKTSFLFNMSHDIRTPMNAITGFTAMAKKYVNDTEKVTDYLDKIDTSGQQLLTLVNQVLEMARIESGKIELEENPVNVIDEYNAMITVLSEQAAASGLEFHHSLNDIRHYNILADRARMSSITLNIAGNAMKYTPRGGRVDFFLKEVPARKPDYATFVFTVSDTGIGMSEDYLKVLFDPFTREKNSTVSRIQGTGLGMSIVKDLVDILEGNIEVQSEQGKGTRFDITVDFRIDEQDAEREKLTQPGGDISLDGCRVLLVEDNEMNREIATDILEDEGLLVESAEDGSVAVEIMKEKGPDYYDFILMDIQMPIMGGYEATKEIRKMYPGASIPIIALSANAFAEDKAASIAAGLDDHVAKPINIGELLGALARFL